MSYDVRLEAMRPVAVYEGNMTSNVSGIWRAALDHCYPNRLDKIRGPGPAEELGAFEALYGLDTHEQADLLEKAAEHITTNPDIYKPMEPKNGWGDFVGAAEFMREIALALRANPDAVISVSR